MKQQLRSQVYSYWVKQYGAFEYRHGWLRVSTCPYCGSEEKLGINLYKDWVNCFSCGNKGGNIQAIQGLEKHKDFGETLRFLKTFSGYDYTPPKVELLEERPVILPEGYMNIRRGEGIGVLARKYLTGRGFSIESLGKKGVGYVRKIGSSLLGYLIIPFYNKRELIYYNTRLFMGSGPKYKNPTKEDFGIGKGQVIYNINALNKFEEVNLLEGVLNALTMGDSSSSIGGKVLSAWQYTQILKSKVQIINIILDRDAWEYAMAMAGKLLPYKKVRLIKLEDDRDPNDLGKEVIDKMIKRTTLISTHSELFTFKNIDHASRTY